MPATLSGVFMLTQSAFSADLPEAGVYATKNTKTAMGPAITEHLDDWSGGKKPIFVIRQEDFPSIPATEKQLKDKLLQIGLPENLHPKDDFLTVFTESFNNNYNYVAAAYHYDTHCIIFGINDDLDMDPTATIERRSGFDRYLIEQFPPFFADFKEYVYKHEAGHCELIASENYDHILRGRKSEIIADQHAIDLDIADGKLTSRYNHNSSAYVFLQAHIIATVHEPGQEKTHDTTPSVFMPWETKIPEYQEPLLFEGNDTENLTALRTYAVKGNKDKELWLQAFEELVYSIGIANSLGAFGNERFGILTEHNIPINVTKFLLNPKEHYKKIEADLKSMTLDDFFDAYQEHPDFITSLTERAGYVLSKRRYDKTGLSAFIGAAQQRLDEITDDRFEKRFLEKYLEATQYFFPNTYQHVTENGFSWEPYNANLKQPIFLGLPKTNPK